MLEILTSSDCLALIMPPSTLKYIPHEVLYFSRIATIINNTTTTTKLPKDYTLLKVYLAIIST